MTPRTLPALRVAVARVLQARGEAADALVCDVERSRVCLSAPWIATIDGVVCNARLDWLMLGGATRADAIGNVWRRFVIELRREFDVAKASAAATRRPERKAAAVLRLERACIALEVACFRDGGGDGA